MAIAVFIFGSMFFAIIMCPLALTSNSIVRPTDEVRRMYESWMAEHGKSYGSKEKETRFQIFQSNVQFVDDHNRPENAHSYTVGLNRFADLTNKEYRKIYLSKKPFEDLHGNASTRYSVNAGDVNIPASIDWRSKGAVTSVKEQGKCGCCWAFTAVGAVEGINQIVTGKLVTLSAQELVDCDTGGSNHGCQGGNMYYAFQFIKNNGGIDTDADYPYKTTQNSCDLKKKNTKIVTIDGYEYLPPNDENALKNAVARQPITVGIESYRREFQLYSNGIYQGPCSYNLDHGALVVGYGEADGVKYWILKNTWGTDWGEKGYMRIQRDSGIFFGKCGMTRSMSYPVKNAVNLNMIDQDSLRIKIINGGGGSRSLDE